MKTCYQYIFTAVDGKKGVDRVEAKVTAKAGNKTMLESMPEDENMVMIYGAQVFKAVYDANGKLMNGEADQVSVHFSHFTPKMFLRDMGKGTPVFEYQAKTFEVFLTRGM